MALDLCVELLIHEDTLGLKQVGLKPAKHSLQTMSHFVAFNTNFGVRFDITNIIIAIITTSSIIKMY
jgi:hypothetical protein